ncbi:MAG: SGNH/GDSL hydrolase family protein [Candidatus Marinimicrobia bacterium]|nr:SGNH/GDSL hydrolase family protein [Candidatus Neomarinimicrobiota bacterium]
MNMLTRLFFGGCLPGGSLRRWAFVFLAGPLLACDASAGMSGVNEEPGAISLFARAEDDLGAAPAAAWLALPDGGFEQSVDGSPAGWNVSGSFAILEEGPPEGRRHIVFRSGGEAFQLQRDDIPVAGNRPHCLSLWVRSTEPLRARLTALDVPDLYGQVENLWIPPTDGRWQRLSLYFRPLHGATRARLQFEPEAAEWAEVALDDVRLRLATEEEFAAVYARWRASFPARDLRPRPTDGRNLALTIRKLEHGFDPERPFRIWAIGSSYVNLLGMGEPIRQAIYQRFGTTPEVVYRKHVGSAVAYQFIRGWFNHQVLADQPDLVLIYALGQADDLERLIRDIRRQTTADIIVPSIHWRLREAAFWGDNEQAQGQDIPALRALCERYGVEFVENRREWAAFMAEQGWAVEVNPAQLLADGVHQSALGALVINENIARHFQAPEQFAYDPAERERRLQAVRPRSIRTVETIETAGTWREADGALVTDEAGATLTIRFQGNRVDLIGDGCADGGSAAVTVNGRPAAEAPACFVGYIRPGPDNFRPTQAERGDFAPHGIELGVGVVPQDWTIRMVDDAGHYELVGSVTGFDGRGSNQEAFTSNSGQIVVPADLWRYATAPRQWGTRGIMEPGVSVNRPGDTFTFSVTRPVREQVSFHDPAGRTFRAGLALNLPNGVHEITLTAAGDGLLSIRAFDIYEPPDPEKAGQENGDSMNMQQEEDTMSKPEVIATAPCAAGVAVDSAEPLYAFDFATAPEQAGWVLKPAGAAPGELVYRPSEGYYESKGGTWTSPKIPCMDNPFQYYTLVFESQAAAGGYYAIFYQDADGQEIVSDVYGSVEPSAAWRANEVCFRGREGAVTFTLNFISHQPVAIRNLAVVPVDGVAVAAWADRLYATLPPLQDTTAASPWALLPATRARLTSGAPVRVVMLGDSIVNDTNNGLWEALVMRLYPRANLQVIPSVRGATGCWYYQDPEVFQNYVVNQGPDLLLIGGISHRQDAAAVRAVIRLTRTRLSACEMLLMSGPMGPDWRQVDPAQPAASLAAQVGEPAREFSAALCALAAEEHVAFLDMHKIWHEYLGASGRPFQWFHRDRVHANDRGKQILARILERFFQPPGDRP